jgi:hypothetical protein
LECLILIDGQLRQHTAFETRLGAQASTSLLTGEAARSQSWVLNQK